MTYRLTRINAALTRIGSVPLASETDGGADAMIAIFDALFQQLVTRTDWSFASKVRQLTRLVDAPEQQWAYQFQLPTDMIGAPRAVYDSAASRFPVTGYQLLGDHLLTDLPAVWLHYSFLPEINRLPGHFLGAFDMALMSELALTVAMDKGLADQLRSYAYGSPGQGGDGGLLGEAMALDAMSKPSPVLAEGSNPLIAARF